MHVDAGIRNDLCRVTVIAPGARIDVALPVQVPLAELLPTLLRQSGVNPVDDPSRGSGWSLQRFGQPAFDTGLTPAALSVLDGEVLYLRPRQAELPELAFDDVADAVATGASAGTRRWADADTRRTGLGMAVAALVVAVLLVLGSGPPWTIPALVAGIITVALAGLAAVLSRAYSDASAGRAPAYAAVLYAVLCGATAFGSDHGPGDFGAPSALGAAAAGLVVAALAALAVADGVAGLLGLGVVALVAMAAAALDVATGVGGAGTAAVVVVLALGLTQLVPVLALRLAELPLPAIPFTAEDVRRDNTLVDGKDVLRRAVVADTYVTALVGAVALLVSGGQLMLSRQPEPGAQWLMAVVAAASALRARAFLGRLQRTFLLLAAGLGGGLLALSLASGQSGTSALLTLVAPVVGVAGVLVAAALRLPGHQVSPVWRRAADLLDGLVVLSLIPVALNVLGVYGAVRGLAG